MRELIAHVRELFSFSKRERPGILLLCLLLLATAALPVLFRGHPDPVPPQLTVRADSFFHARREDGTDAMPGRSADEGSSFRHPSSLFWFDPNTLSFSDWQKLGLPDRTIRVIMHYLEKGGRFQRPDDLGRIWGLPRGEYERLRPYVRIASHGTNGTRREVSFVARPYRYLSFPCMGSTGHPIPPDGSSIWRSTRRTVCNGWHCRASGRS